jgi:hypothetical protein
LTRSDTDSDSDDFLSFPEFQEAIVSVALAVQRTAPSAFLGHTVSGLSTIRIKDTLEKDFFGRKLFAGIRRYWLKDGWRKAEGEWKEEEREREEDRKDREEIRMQWEEGEERKTRGENREVMQIQGSRESQKTSSVLREKVVTKSGSNEGERKAGKDNERDNEIENNNIDEKDNKNEDEKDNKNENEKDNKNEDEEANRNDNKNDNICSQREKDRREIRRLRRELAELERRYKGDSESNNIRVVENNQGETNLKGENKNHLGDNNHKACHNNILIERRKEDFNRPEFHILREELEQLTETT